MGPNFISPESVKNVACVGQKIYKIGQNKSPTASCSELLKKHEAEFGLLGPSVLMAKSVGVSLIPVADENGFRV